MFASHLPTTLAIFAAACTCLAQPVWAIGCGDGAVERGRQDTEVGAIVRWCERDGARDGKYVVEHPDGTLLLSMRYRRGTPHGPMTRWHHDGTIAMVGNYAMGLPHGTFMAWGRAGELVGRYTMHHGSGIARTWWDNGKLREEASFLAGVRHGARRWFRPDGSKQRVGGYRDGLPHGLWTAYHPSGQANGTYVLDRGTGTVVTWHFNGQRRARGQLRNGDRHGVWFTWHENGQRESRQRWVDGARKGRGLHWHSSGHRAGDVVWRNGRRHGAEKQWDFDGYRSGERVWRRGELHGLELRWNHGTFVELRCHRDGELTWRAINPVDESVARTLACAD